MKLDDVFCFDCALYQTTYGVGCLRCTPAAARVARDEQIQKVIRDAQRNAVMCEAQQRKRGQS